MTPRAEPIRLAGDGGLELVGDVRGTGRPALLLHGGGQTRHSWDETARELAHAGYAAVSLDMRGHGDSARSPQAAYSPYDFAADAAAVAQTLADRYGGAPVAIGASLGGMAALIGEGLAAAAGGPPLWSALVLVDITPRLEPSGVEKIQGFMRLHAAEGFATIEAAADAVAAYLPHRPRPPSAAGLAKNLHKGADGRYYWHWDPRFLDGPRPVNHDIAGVRAAMEAGASSLRIPTLLVRGAASELVREEQVRAFLQLAKGADYVDVGGARHMVAGDRNDVFRHAILDFLGRRLG